MQLGSPAGGWCVFVGDTEAQGFPALGGLPRNKALPQGM